MAPPPENNTTNQETVIPTATLTELISRLTKDIDKSHAKDYPPLPTFYGDIENWKIFYDDYEQSTKQFIIPDHANMKRLEKSLRGSAYKHVRKYLARPNCLEIVIEELKTEFGPKADITNTMLNKCDNLPKLVLNQKNLREFTIEVLSMQTTIDRSNVSGLGVIVVDKLQKKTGQCRQVRMGEETNGNRRLFLQ